MFIKKRYIILIIACIIALIAGLFYYREFRSLPDFSVQMLESAKEAKETDTVVLFAPHSDDETISSGGFIHDAVKNGAKVVVVLVTNGDGHIFSTMEDFRKLYPTAQNYIDSGVTRQEESLAALKILGVKEEDVIFLGYPDHGIKELHDKNWKIPYQSPYTKKTSSPYANSFTKGVEYTGDNLENDIIKILETYKPTIVISSYQHDIHPDHAATYRFVKKSIQDSQIDTIKSNLYYVVHYRNFPYPLGLKTDRFVAPPAKLIDISVQWLKYMMDDQVIETKNDALRQYKSQINLPTLKGLLEGFVRQNELFVIETEENSAKELGDTCN